MIKVSREVYDNLEQIRSSGEINMFDRSGVYAIAIRDDLDALINWLGTNKKDYICGIFEGFEVK